MMLIANDVEMCDADGVTEAKDLTLGGACTEGECM
jgi:hypothetical protein